MPITALDDRSALILIDLQKGITALAPDAVVAPPIAAAARLATGFRAAGLPVVLVRVDFSADRGDVPRNRTDWPTPVGTPPPDFAEVHDGVGRRSTDLVVTKRQPGAFHGTDLDLQLRRRGVTGIVLGGLFTSMGVESTGRAAYDHGYNVAYAADAMADPQQDRHLHSVQRVFPMLGEVGTVDDVLDLLLRRQDLTRTA